MQTDFQQVGESQFLFNIPEADSINHIVVFLTGTMPLPLGMAGSVYFSWPDPAQPPSWILLGYISNAKPSAIFKISQLKKQSDTQNAVVPFGGTYNIFGAQPISHIAQIGVSIEPEANVVNLTPAIVSVTTPCFLSDLIIIIIIRRQTPPRTCSSAKRCSKTSSIMHPALPQRNPKWCLIRPNRTSRSRRCTVGT